MTVQKKKDGRVFVVYSKNGKRVWEPFGRGPHAEKAAKTRDLELQLQQSRGIPLPETRTPFNTLFQRYLDTRASELAETTLDEICRTAARNVMPQIGEKPVGAVTLRDWAEIQAAMLDRGCAAATVNRLGAYMNRFWKWAVHHGYLQAHPWINREPIRARKKFQVELFTLDEFRRIYAAAAPHLAFALELLYYTGCRPGRELCALKWEDIDWARCRLRIFAPKTGHARWQWLPEPFVARARERYKAQMKRYPECPWMISFRGRQVDSLRRSWGEAKAAAGITRPLRLYDVRHFYISQALAQGAPIMDLATRVGHASPDMIVRFYAHLVEDLRREEPLRIPEL